jgi:hypothetical protein
MANDFFGISLMIYSLIFISIMFFQIYSYFKFKIFLKKKELISLLDNLYELAIYIVGFLYLALYISGIADVFLNIKKYTDWKLPFVIYAMPLMVITFRILVNQGLYAYNSSTFFIRSKESVRKENVKLHGVKKYSYVNRAKIIVSIKNQFNVQEKKYVIRTSLNNLQPFIKLFG